MDWIGVSRVDLVRTREDVVDIVVASVWGICYNWIRIV